MRHNSSIRKRRDKRWYKSPRRIFKCIKRLIHLCFVLLLFTTLFYITNLTLLYLNIKLPDFFDIEIPFKLIRTRSDTSSNDSNAMNTPINSIIPINSVTPYMPTTSPTTLTSASIVTAYPTLTPTHRPTSTPIPTLAPPHTLAPTVLISSTPITMPNPSMATYSTSNALPNINPTAVATYTTSAPYVATIKPTATVTSNKEILIDPFNDYRPIIKLNLSSTLISDVYNSENHIISDSSVTFSIEKNILYIMSDTHFVDVSYNVNDLKTLTNLGITHINIQEFTMLNISFMLKEFEVYNIKTFQTYWKENNGCYEVNITFDQSLLSILFNGVCAFDLTKLNP